MKRRSAIKQIGLGISAGIILPSWLSACRDNDPQPEIKYDGVVGIVGAGAAGLYSADILRAKGVQVRIFEASDYIGGRVRTLNKFMMPTEALLFDADNRPSSKFPTELGAQLVYGSDSAWGKVVEQFNVQTLDIAAVSEDYFFIDGAIKSETDLAADADFIAAKNFTDTIATYTGGNVSVQQAMNAAGLTARVKNIVNSWIGNVWGTSNANLSMKALAEGLALLTRNRTQLVIKSNPVEDVLLSQFSGVISLVEKNTAVKSINYSGDKITVSGEKKSTGGGVESFSADVDKLILTVPVSVIKAGMINFSPALPSDKTAALTRIDMDAAIRIRLEFKQNFWGNSPGFILGGIEAPMYFNAGIGRDDLLKTLDVTIQGSQAAQLSAMGKDMVPVILEELDAVYEGQASVNVRKNANDEILAVIMDWTKEEYIRGGVSYSKPGGTNDDRIVLGKPVEGKLFFAGEATDVAGEFATISGALNSAERAAMEVVEEITA